MEDAVNLVTSNQLVVMDIPAYNEIDNLSEGVLNSSNKHTQSRRRCVAIRLRT
jgi:hypothetical protein